MSLGLRRELRWFRLWWWIGAGLVLGVIYLSLTPHPPRTPGLWQGDKLGHFSAYFTLMFWFGQLYLRPLHGRWLLGFILLGIGLEFVQGQTSYRSFEYADMAANSLGALIAWAIVASPVTAGWLMRREAGLKARWFRSG